VGAGPWADALQPRLTQLGCRAAPCRVSNPQVLEGWYPSADAGKNKGLVLVVTASKEGAVTGGQVRHRGRDLREPYLRAAQLLSRSLQPRPSILQTMHETVEGALPSRPRLVPASAPLPSLRTALHALAAVADLLPTPSSGPPRRVQGFVEAVGDELIDSIITTNIPIFTEEEKYNQTVLSTVERLEAKLLGNPVPGEPAWDGRKHVSVARPWTWGVKLVWGMGCGCEAEVKEGRLGRLLGVLGRDT
jgi:hypothetical protein